MSDTQEAARRLAAARWANTVLDKAVETVIQRSDHLDADQRARLREVADHPLLDISEAQRSGLRDLADQDGDGR